VATVMGVRLDATHLLADANLPATAAFSARVLLVEDNQVNQMVAQRMLEGLGCTVALAANGIDALEKLARERFDLVICYDVLQYLESRAAARAWRISGAGGLNRAARRFAS